MKLFLKTFALLLILIVIALISFQFYMLEQVDKKVLNETEQSFSIEPGESVKLIARRLEKENVLREQLWFYWYARISGLSGKVKTGEFQIQPGISEKELLALFVKGKVKQYGFTIIEGWSFKQLLAALSVEPLLNNDIKGKSFSQIMGILGNANLHPEGQFLPDTYYYTKNTKVSKLLERSSRDMQQYLEEQWPKRDISIPIKSKYEALILASIVEKETGAKEERPLIAGVFSNRLKKGMRLQTDPTVIYGMGDRYKGDIRFRDLREATPYNTYKIPALPPTPIAMPGREAIDAVLHPEKTEALYFVAMGSAGRHYFSNTLKEHEAAVDRYQRNR